MPWRMQCGRDAGRAQHDCGAVISFGGRTYLICREVHWMERLITGRVSAALGTRFGEPPEPIELDQMRRTPQSRICALVGGGAPAGR